MVLYLCCLFSGSVYTYYMEKKTTTLKEKVLPEQTVESIEVEWKSPSRLFKRRDKEYFTNIGAIVFLLCVILVFAREFVLIAAVLSIVFLIYVLSTVPPEEVKHKITSMGIESAGHYYRYEQLVDFWFEEQWGQTMAVVRVYGMPRIIMLMDNKNMELVKEALSVHIPFRETPERNFVDSAAKWLTEKIPLEKPS